MRGGMGMSTGFRSFCRPRFLVLLGILFSPTVTFGTKNIHVRAGPDRGVAGPPYPDDRDLATGVAVEVHDLVVLAQQLQLSTRCEAQPFAEQLLAIAARIGARLDRHHGAPATLIVPGGTVKQSATMREVGNATHGLALGLRGGPSQTEPGEMLLQAPVLEKPGEMLPQALVLKPGETEFPPPAVKPGEAVPPSPVMKHHSVSWDDPISEKEEQASFLLALVFVGIIASSPIVPHLKRGAPPPTKAHYFESVCLFLWLFGGLYLFTNVIIFQSPHFATNRTLRLEESVYLISQIVTTVGYGDVTPAHVFGQVVIGTYAFVSVILVTQILSDLVSTFETVMERRLARTLSVSDVDEELAETRRQKLWAAFVPVIQSGGVFVLFVILGSAFFCLYPGEGKTLGQAIYMSTITLSTVGFGAITPVTRAGMVFGAYWMLFGVGSLGALVSARVAFSSSLVRFEREKDLQAGWTDLKER